MCYRTRKEAWHALVLMFCLCFLLGTKFDVSSVCFFFLQEQNHTSLLLLASSLSLCFLPTQGKRGSTRLVCWGVFSEYLINLIMYIILGIEYTSERNHDDVSTVQSSSPTPAPNKVLLFCRS